MDKKNIYKALFSFQNEVPILHKDTSGYGYTYTDLPEIVRIITPHLQKNGLGFTQLIENNQLKTIVFHVESGETLESISDIPTDNLKGMNQFQILGSAITYLRRYSLSAILGLVTDKDMDASSIEDKLQRCANLNDLNYLFKNITKEQQTQFQTLFTNRKNELTTK